MSEPNRGFNMNPKSSEDDKFEEDDEDELEDDVSEDF